MEKSWKLLKNLNPEITKNLAQELNVSNIIAELLVKRNITNYLEAKLFFRPRIEDLLDPFLMKGMSSAVNKIIETIESNKKIMIYGDYDVDGTTSVALLYLYLTKLNADLIYYIPDRYLEGYGLSNQGINKAKEEKVSLIIVVDCGIKANDQIDLANSYNIESIICDHHYPGINLPKSLSILNPKQSDCKYPYKELCGCGIGFKLIQAIEQKKGKGLDSIIEFLDLVTIAICADVVPMTGENRVLASLGLKLINKEIRPGLKNFIKNKNNQINVSDLIFKIAPRINAAGRMKHGKHAVELLISVNEKYISTKSRTIELLNSERKLLDGKITKEALEQIENLLETNSYSTVVFRPDWHKGVIGIVASRLIEYYYRPTIVLTKSGENYTGSVRSVKGFDVYETLSKCSAHLIQYGGHKYAAGLTLNPSKYSDFKTAFEKEVMRTILPEQRIKSISYDLETTFNYLTNSVCRIVEQMKPFGPLNMPPLFYIKNCIDSGQTKLVGADNNHLKLEVKDETGTTFSGIGFEMGKYISKIKMKTPFSIIAQVRSNEFMGRSKFQLNIKDISFK
ncbi:MAG: single-stranded-DNA-specific exonuclease RecJ [Flavobacteriaceae bacterium]|nr:single-stranded-DNA-specific exonuclease RecJ [Flavobacteriaceae bacterium]|tara:strand:+ start:2780 stop:4477 length:1698 start_codon:yes stop_codon:yes gene_type:complete